MRFSNIFIGLLGAALALSQTPAQGPAGLLSRITPEDLKGNLSFLSSDALAGRFTPSPGLDVAAEFIASRFRADGLEPGGDDGYFQTAQMVDRKMPKLASDIGVSINSKEISVAPGDAVVYSAIKPASFKNAPAVIFQNDDPEALKQADVKGKVVLREQPDFYSMPRDQGMKEYRKSAAFSEALRSVGAALEIRITGASLPHPRGGLLAAEVADKDGMAVLIVRSPALLAAIKEAGTAKVSANIPAPQDTRIVARNVVGVLRGADPKLKSTYVLLTAHYDHIGTSETAVGLTNQVKNSGNDHIYNGANDDGSGTVSVIEVAHAFAKTNPHPKRSIVFMTFFGEERGEIGSNYFADHPLWPLQQIVVDVNLEQVGRTDASDGKQVNTASLTGYDYSTLTRFFEKAGAQLGVKLYKNAQASDQYFTQSDNAALAEKGVPAETLCVAFDYPDYHGLADTWDKIDYTNMARVDRVVALAVLNMANDPQPVAWNAQNEKTEAFREAQKKLNSSNK